MLFGAKSEKLSLQLEQLELQLEELESTQGGAEVRAEQAPKTQDAAEKSPQAPARASSARGDQPLSETGLLSGLRRWLAQLR